MSNLVSKRLFVLPFATLAIGAFSTGCFSGSQQGGAVPHDETHSGPAWALKLTTSCDLRQDEYCVGMYGFTVSADQKYVIGPGPNRQLSSGFLSEAEFEKLASIVGEISTAALHDQSCDERSDMIDGVEEKITIVRNGVEKELVSTDSTHLCYETESSDSADRLHNALRELAEKYYVLPFPDACTEAAAAVSSLYVPLQSCNQDSDCVYVGTNYDVIPPGGTQFVITDNCSAVHPLVVANSALLPAAKHKLLEGFANAQSVCGDRIVRDECTSITGFESNIGAPVCRQNYCRVSPNATSTR